MELTSKDLSRSGDIAKDVWKWLEKKGYMRHLRLINKWEDILADAVVLLLEGRRHEDIKGILLNKYRMEASRSSTIITVGLLVESGLSEGLEEQDKVEIKMYLAQLLAGAVEGDSTEAMALRHLELERAERVLKSTHPNAHPQGVRRYSFDQIEGEKEPRLIDHLDEIEILKQERQRAN